MGASEVSCRYFMGVLRVFQKYFKGVFRFFMGVSRVFDAYFNVILKMILKCFIGV